MNRKLFKAIFIALVLAITVFSFTACSKVEFKIEFMVEGEVYWTINTNGEETVKLPADPQREGYTFDGWYWDEGVWKQPFTVNSLLDTPLSSSMKVYAKWISKEDLTGTQIQIEGFEAIDDRTFRFR